MDERPAIAPGTQGTVPTTQMTSIWPALTWEESASAMLVYIEDLRDKVLETYKTRQTAARTAQLLAVGWIKNMLDHGKVPGLGAAGFRSDHVLRRRPSRTPTART